jgi:ParB family chromosome partitioning protein
MAEAALQFVNDVQLVGIDRVRPNAYNPNRLTRKMFASLVDDIRRNGFIGAIVVREKDGGYEIVDGEHRYKALLELGAAQIPVIVVDNDDVEARVNTIGWDRKRGDFAPRPLAELVHDLNKHFSLKDLGALVCFEERELKDALDILKLPRDLDDKVAAAAAAEEAEAPVVLKFVVTTAQAEVVNAAVEKAARKRRGDGIAAIAAEWLEARRDG